MCIMVSFLCKSQAFLMVQLLMSEQGLDKLQLLDTKWLAQDIIWTNDDPVNWN